MMWLHQAVGKNYFARIVLVVVLVVEPLLTVVRTRTFPLLVVCAVDLMRILIVRPIKHLLSCDSPQNKRI